jgi:uncharacterized protein (DUF2062 family)
MLRRQVVKRYLQRHAKLHEDQRLRFLYPLLHGRQMLRFTRRSVTGGVAIELFCVQSPYLDLG